MSVEDELELSNYKLIYTCQKCGDQLFQLNKGWIDVQAFLPPVDSDVLVCDTLGIFYICFFVCKRFNEEIVWRESSSRGRRRELFLDAIHTDITHWIPLPPGPNE